MEHLHASSIHVFLVNAVYICFGEGRTEQALHESNEASGGEPSLQLQGASSGLICSNNVYIVCELQRHMPFLTVCMCRSQEHYTGGALERRASIALCCVSHVYALYICSSYY